MTYSCQVRLFCAKLNASFIIDDSEIKYYHIAAAPSNTLEVHE